MALTVQFVGGVGRADIVELLRENISHGVDPTSTYHEIGSAVISVKGITIIPATGFEIDHCTYGTTIHPDDQPEPIVVPQTNTGTGASAKICTWTFAEWQSWITGGGVVGQRQGYDKITVPAGVIDYPWGMHYDSWTDTYWPGTSYQSETHNTQDAVLIVYLKANPHGIIRANSNGQLMRSNANGLVMYYP